MKRLTTVLLIWLAVTPASSEESGASAVDPAQARLRRIEARLETEPNSPELHHFLASARAQLGQREGALASLREAARVGAGLLPDTARLFPTLADDPDYQALYQQFLARLPKVTTGRVWQRLSDPSLLPEGITYDRRRREVLVTSLTQGTVLAIDGRETLKRPVILALPLRR